MYNNAKHSIKVAPKEAQELKMSLKNNKYWRNNEMEKPVKEKRNKCMYTLNTKEKDLRKQEKLQNIFETKNSKIKKRNMRR